MKLGTTKRILRGRIFLATVALSVGYWLAETAAHAFVFKTGTFGHELMSSTLNEMWMRTFTALLFLTIGVLGQNYSNRVHEYQDRLRKLAQAVDAAGDGIVITGTSGIIEYVNAAFTDITGYSSEEAVGQSSSLLKSGTKDASYYREMWREIGQGRAWSGQVTDRRKDGTYFPAHLSISPILDEQGKATHFVGIQRDLSDRVALEQSLQEAKKMEAIATLSGGIAHDFNNMLATLSACVHLGIRRADGNEPVEEIFALIKSTTTTAASLVKQLMVFSRGQQGPADQQPLCLAEFAGNLGRILPLLIPASVEFRIDSPGSDLWVKADASQLQQVFMNLVGNARDSVLGTADASIVLSFHEAPEGAPRQGRVSGLAGIPCVRVNVSDNGPGVPSLHRARIFDAFYTTKEEGRGTGLGLAMVAELVTQHAGAVSVGETEEGGASFDVFLPLTQERPAETPLLVSEQLAVSEGEMILLVDDQLTFRKSTKAVLETLGYQVLEAEDGVSALRVFDSYREQVDILISDVVMPNMSGPLLCAEVRKIRRDLPVLFATGYDRGELDTAEPIALSMVLHKPFSMARLSHALRDLLALGRDSSKESRTSESKSS